MGFERRAAINQRAGNRRGNKRATVSYSDYILPSISIKLSNCLLKQQLPVLTLCDMHRDQFNDALLYFYSSLQC